MSVAKMLIQTLVHLSRGLDVVVLSLSPLKSIGQPSKPQFVCDLLTGGKQCCDFIHS